MKLVLDCPDPSALAPFWAAALGYRVAGSVENYTLLVPDDTAGAGSPQLLLQQVDEPKAGKNRMHLDLENPDIEGEAARLEQLGARRLSTDGAASEHGQSWLVMADPAGNEFCVCDGGHPATS
jgi:hypothetical protein